MKLLAFALFLIGTLADAADAYLVVPTARGANLPLCLEGIRVAKANGYEGVVFAAGTGNIPVAEKIDDPAMYADLRVAVREVLLLGLKGHIRLGQRWAGDTSLRPYRPHETSWPFIARIWQNAKNAVAAECTAASAPSPRFSFELCNEPGLGGANGPQYGSWSTARVYYNEWKRTGDKATFLKAFPEEFYGKPEGYIEPGFWKMMRYLRLSTSFGGFQTQAVSFEGDHQAEMLSAIGPDFEKLMDGCSGFGLNKYGGDSRAVWFHENGRWARRPASPSEMADKWAFALVRSLGWARAMPALNPSRLEVWVTELGTFSDYAAPDWTPNAYRTAIVRRAKEFPGIRMGGLFTFKATDRLGDGYSVGAGVTP